MKNYTTPTVNIIEIEIEDAILSASSSTAEATVETVPVPRVTNIEELREGVTISN